MKDFQPPLVRPVPQPRLLSGGSKRSSDAQLECGHRFRFQSSVREPGEGLMPGVQKRTLHVSWLASFFFVQDMRPGDFAEKSPGRLRLIGCQLWFEDPLGKLWPLLSVGEGNLPIRYNAPSRFDREWPNSLQNDGGTSLI